VLLGLLRREEGIALVLALGTMTVVGMLATTAMFYATSNESNASRSSLDMSAHSLAEAGVNNAMAVLSNPPNGVVCDPQTTCTNILPNSLGTANVSTYGNGYVKWWGVYDATTSTWQLNANGYERNPATTGGQVVRRVSVTTKMRPTPMQPNQNPVWNYIVSMRTGTPGGCDETLDNGINIASPLYVMGNLCLNTPSQITGGPVVVKGSVNLDVNTNIGTNANRINEVHVVGGCSWKGNPYHVPCGPADKVYATVSDATAPALTAPTVDLDYWYANAIPGPKNPCSSVSGTPPVFDNNTVRDTGGSVPGVFELTPIGSDYSCIVRAGSRVIGQLTWDHAAKLLTVNGTIYIDGSASIDYGQQNVPISYRGAATLYLSGTLLIKTTKLCGGISSDGQSCDFNNWDPNTNLLLIVAMGQGGQLPAGDSIELVSSYFQGALWGGYAIELNTSSSTEGPMIASTEIIGQTVYARSFPVVNIPAGAPGVPITYVAPDPPTNYSS